jgi:hypothetical protein
MKRNIRALVTGAGTGSSGNLIRALQAIKPTPHIVGVNHDRFMLKMSWARRNYLSPDPDSREFVKAILAIIKQERINVVLPTDDNVVKTLSDARDRLPIELLLPRKKTIDLCQDKYALNAFLRRRSIAAPLTYEVRSLPDIDRIFARFSQDGLLWCRARRGARSVAAIPVATAEQARAWITLWRDLHGIRVSDFTLGEYLPGRHLIVQGLWRSGRLLRAQTMEVLSYFAVGNNPSAAFSLSNLAKTVEANEPLEVALAAVHAIERMPSGTLIVELKERMDGTPCITEINAGRFPAGVTALLATGGDNMVETFACAALGEVSGRVDPKAAAVERYLVRDIDSLPMVLSPAELLQDARRADLARSKQRRRRK